MRNLYEIDLDGAPWRSCGGNNGGASGTEACVAMADIPGVDGGVALRDTKLGPDSPTLRFDAAEWSVFRAALVA